MIDPELSRKRAQAGRRGGLAKGLKGNNLLPPEIRSENARKAANARWSKTKENKDEE